MNRDQERAIWSLALNQYGLERLEKHVSEHISGIFIHRADVDLPFDASADGLAQVVGLVLEELLSGDRPLLSGYRVMNRSHLQALCQIRVSLAEALLKEIPITGLPRDLKRLRAQADLGI